MPLKARKTVAIRKALFTTVLAQNIKLNWAVFKLAHNLQPLYTNTTATCRTISTKTNCNWIEFM